MLSKQITKIIQNLEKKKFREKYNLFKIEGEKLVAELLRSPLAVHAIIAYPEWIQANGHLLGKNQVLETDEKGRTTDPHHYHHGIAGHVFGGQPGVRRHFLGHGRAYLPGVCVWRHRAGHGAGPLSVCGQ